MYCASPSLGNATANSNNIIVPLDKEASVDDLKYLVKKSDTSVIVHSNDYLEEVEATECKVLINMRHIDQLIAEGKTVAEIADQTSKNCDIDLITGFMYGCAVNALSQCWTYGEELRKWHNNDYGYEGDGVVNPAVLTVNVD